MWRLDAAVEAERQKAEKLPLDLYLWMTLGGNPHSPGMAGAS
jgi:hypothetical protein